MKLRTITCMSPRSIERPVKNAVASIICGLASQLIGFHANAQSAQQIRPNTVSPVEEIYVVRSVRETRIAPTDFCSEAKVGFVATDEDQYAFKSIATRASDGRVIDSDVETIGKVRVCLGQTPHPGVTNFYGEGLLGRTAFSGVGECRTMKIDFPEHGLYPLRCFLDLSGLPAGYVGGELTSNTLLSRKVLGTDTDPPGYTQSSIATIRLWKSPAER